MNKNIISENPLKSQEGNKPIEKKVESRVDLNFVKLPVWSTIPKRGTIFVPSKTIHLEPKTLKDGRLLQRKIEIVPTAKYGYPTVLAQESFYGMQYLWQQQTRPLNGEIHFSKQGTIVDVLGKTYGRNTRKAFELSLNQLATTAFEFTNVIYDQEKDITHTEIKQFHLIRNLHLSEKKEKNEIIHDKCSLILHELVISNLLNNYCKPILLSVVTNLKSDIAKLLYTKIDTQFSHINQYEISTERFFKEHGLQGSDYHKPSIRKRLLEKGTKELIGKLTSSGATITHYEFLKTANNKDWKLIVYSDGVQQKKRKRKEQKSQEIIEVKLEKKVTTSQQEPTTQGISSDIQEVLTKFENTFGVSNYKPNKHAITIIKNLLKNHSINVVKSWIYDASVRCLETNYKPKTINGIKKFIEPYFAELKARKKREEREQQ